MKFNYLSWLLSAAICCLLFSSKASAMDVYMRCTNTMTIYADGVQKATHTSATTTKHISNFPDSTEVVAVKCVGPSNPSTTQRGGIMVQFNDEYTGDYQTDSTWRCSSTYSASWTSKTFDDSTWGYAEVTGDNSATANGLTHISSLKNYIKWIWTPDYLLAYGDTTVYCRGYPKIPQTHDSYGRRFVVGFMDNRQSSPRKDIKLLFTTLTPTDVSVRITTPLNPSGLTVDHWLSVKAGEVKTYVLPQNLRHYDTNVKDYGVLVVATQPVKIIGLNQEMYSTDMVLMLPITSLGTSTTNNVYYTVSWDDATDARILLVSGYDSTAVTVKSKVSFYYKGSSKGATTVHTLDTLNKYKTVQLTASSGSSGMKITSTKPLVVYSGNKKAGVYGTGSCCSSDHLVEQLTPYRNWGKKFILTPMKNGGDTRTNTELEKYIYVAGSSSATVTVKNYYESNGNLQQTKTFTLAAEGVKKDIAYLKGTYAYVTSTSGIQIAQFATTAASSECRGDPWMQLIPPIDEFSRDYGLLTPVLEQSSTCPAQHYVTLIVHKDDVNGITVNGASISLASATTIASTDYKYLTYTLTFSETSGVRIQHTKTSVSFGCYFFGYGRWDSYATMGGSRMAPINEPCTNTQGVMGDGIDNDCDGKIDEDDCTTNDPNKDCGAPTPIDGDWSAWAAEGSCACSASTGSNGVQTYKRKCDSPTPQFNGLPCANSNTKTTSCACVKVDGGWSAWESYGACSNCARTRSRKCNNPVPSTYPVGATCAGDKDETSNHWGNWGSYSTCGSCSSRTNMGVKSRSKSCTSPCSGSQTDTASCSCAVDGNWGNWGSYGSCTQSCGSGTKTRTRSCNNPAPLYGGNQCPSSSTDTASCNTHNCPIHGNWANWGSWGSCTKTCATGSKTRIRTCTNPAPQYSGNACSGSATDTSTCNTHPCPINGNWANWGSWGTCTKSCGTGSQTRTKTCTNPAPQHGGSNCPGSDTSSQNCNTHNCPIHGNWAAWSLTAGSCDCSAQTARGSQTYTRTCTNPSPQYGGNQCATNINGASKVQSNDCDCDIDGEWGTWTAWASCTATCGERTKTRTRQCDNPPQANNGADCVGDNSDTVNCTWVYCPIHGGWNDWENETCQCNSNPFQGYRIQSRLCNNPTPQYNGNNCPGNNERMMDCDCMEEITGSDQFYKRLNYTCEETPSSPTTDTIADCLMDCVLDSSCYAFIYKQNSSNKCSLMTDCTPTYTNETITGTGNWVNITLFIKESLITTTPLYGVAGVQHQNGGEDNSGDSGSGANILPIVGGAVGGAAVLAGLLFLLARRWKKKKEDKKPLTNSAETNDMEVEDFDDAETAESGNASPTGNNNCSYANNDFDF